VSGGSGIVLLHGNKVGGLGIGTSVGWVWDFQLLGYSGRYKVTFTDDTVIEGHTSANVYLEPRHLGKVVRSIESVGGTPDLTDGFGNTVIYIGREVEKGGMIILEFDAGSGALKHRAADGNGFIPVGSYAEFQLVGRDITSASEKYKQEANLDLLGDQNGNGVFGESGDLNWTPVGAQVMFGIIFRGTFDGDGKDIANLCINWVGINGAALFAGTPEIIKNVHIRSGLVRGRANIGGFVGEFDRGTIKNCSNNAAIKGDYSNVGGIVGSNYGTGTITACSNTGSVTVSGMNAGGVVGSNSGTMTACSNTGSVTASQYWAGGVGGSNTGTITACYNTGSVTASQYWAGGVAGDNGGTITACYNVGPVWANSISTAGGVVSGNTNGGSTIACYWLPNVLGGNATVGCTGGPDASLAFSQNDWPNDVINADWHMGSADGSPGNYWKSMGTPSDNPGPNDFPKLYWE
jgi:hypothetical protein